MKIYEAFIYSYLDGDKAINVVSLDPSNTTILSKNLPSEGFLTYLAGVKYPIFNKNGCSYRTYRDFIEDIDATLEKEPPLGSTSLTIECS